MQPFYCTVHHIINVERTPYAAAAISLYILSADFRRRHQVDLQYGWLLTHGQGADLSAIRASWVTVTATYLGPSGR